MKRQQKVHEDSSKVLCSHPLLGLDSFQKSLETIFFATSKITYKRDAGQIYHLTIDLNCNLNLINALFHSNMGNWGGLHNQDNDYDQSPMEQVFFELHSVNAGCVDIAEIYINLRDTSLIITKINEQCICHLLDSLLLAVRENFVHFTNGLLEVPYEIFIPVFEFDNEKVYGENILPLKEIGGYFDYWGLYFLSRKNQDPIIYDIKNQRFIDIDLRLTGLQLGP